MRMRGQGDDGVGGGKTRQSKSLSLNGSPVLLTAADGCVCVCVYTEEERDICR